MRLLVTISLAVVLAAVPGVPLAADAELSARTLAAFDAYVRRAEAVQASSLAGRDRFLAVLRLPDDDRARQLERLANGDITIERVTLPGAEVPGGLVHHWVGTVFLPGVTARRAVALLQDYDRHDIVFAPAVAGSRIIDRPSAGEFDVALRFTQTHVITVTLDTRHHARFTWHEPTRASSRIVSTAIEEVEGAGTPGERRLPAGRDGGYLWRLNSYWRFLERDGGTYVECETISLTRGIPFGLGWAVGPYVRSVPRQSLAFTLERTRSALVPARRAAR